MSEQIQDDMISRLSLSDSKAVVVLGMHRSGTSLITRSLEACGVQLGHRLIAGGRDNEKGYFEDAAINQLNENILSEMERAWYSILLPEIESDVRSSYVEKGLSVLRSGFLGMKTWAVKEPRITRLHFIWERIFELSGADVHYLLANRHPFSVAASLARRDQISRLHALVLWLIHQAAGLQTILAHGGIVVDYDLVMDRPSEQLDRIARYIDTQPTNPDEFISGFIDKGLRHCNYSDASSQPDANEIEKIAVRMYRFLRKAAENNSVLDAQEAGLLLADIKSSLARNEDWLQAMDRIALLQHRQDMAKQTILAEQMEDMRKVILRQESRITWMEGRFFYSWPRKVRRLLANSLETNRLA